MAIRRKGLSRMIGFGRQSAQFVVPALVWLCAILWCGGLCAATIDESLAAAEQAYRDGDYRSAAAELKDTAKSLATSGAEQRLRYWDLVANVMRDSGLLIAAEQAAGQHLDLLRQGASTTGGDSGDMEQRSMVRLALIRRELAGGLRRGGARTASATRYLESARDLLVAALAMPSNREPDSPWEAETRLELARTLDGLAPGDEVRREYAAANSAAIRAMREIDDSSESTDEWLLGLAVVQRAFGEDDRLAAANQAALAIKQIQSRLGGDDNTVADRLKLRLAEASCFRQLRDSQAEERLLSEAVRDVVGNPEIDRLELAGAMVRLAELAEARSDAQQQGRADKLYEGAARLYVQTLEDARTNRIAGDKLARSIARKQEAECLLKLALIFTRLERWPEAIAAADELLRLRAGPLLVGPDLSRSDPTYFRALTALGTLHARAARAARERSAGEVARLSDARAHVADAKRYLVLATEFWRQYRPRRSDELAISLNYYAEVLRYDGHFQQANRLLEEAMPDFQSSMPDQADLRLGEFYSNRAAVLAALGQFITARQSYDEAIKVCQADSAEESRSRRRLLAVVYLNQAQLYKSQRQYADARQLCTSALDAADQAWLSPADRIPFQLAEASLLIAEAEQQWREYDAAGEWNERAERDVQERLERAFASAQGALDIGGEESMSQNVAMALHLQALARYLQARLCGDGDEALQQAKTLWLRIIDPTIQQNAGGTAVFRVRALNYLAALSLRDAMESRTAARRADNPDDAKVWTELGDEQLRDAGRWSQEAEALAERVAAYPAAQFQVLVTRAQVLDATAQIAQARERARGRTVEPALARQETAAAGTGYGSVATAEAIDKLYEALELIELPRGMTIGAEEERAVYFSQFAPAFDMLVDLLVKQQRYVEAIEVSEQRRSRTFLDQLRASGVDIYATVPESDRRLIEEEQKIADEYFTTVNRIQENSSDEALVEDLAKLRTLKEERYEAHKRVVSASRAYRQLLVEPLRARRATAQRHRPDAEWVRERIGDDNVALVYCLGSKHSYVFVCDSQTGVEVHPLGVSNRQARTLGLAVDLAPSLSSDERPLRLDDAASLVNRVLFSIKPDIFRTERGSGMNLVRRTKYRPEDVPAVTDVLLPASLQARVARSSARHLLIVPDGALHQLPFEALSTGNAGQPYLLDVLPPVVYAPSLQIYQQLVSEQSGPRQEPIGPRAPAAAGRGSSRGRISLLSVANPNYRGLGGTHRDISLTAPASYATEFNALGGSLARLPGTRDESDAVCRAFEQALAGQVDVVPLTEDRATESNVRRALDEKQYTFLHFAVHGLVDQSYQNLFGALAFSTPQRPTPTDDGFLSLHEIVTLPSPLDACNLAVLSACETNCGPQSPLEAGSTMARAFLCAGAQRVVCSHWSVSDKETTELISRLMQNVAQDLAKDGRVDYAEALYEAKKKLSAKPLTAAPVFWAPFVLIGPPTGGETSAELF